MTLNKSKTSKKLVEQVLNPVELLDYQEDSIVSKIIIERKTGSVTLFAFDEKQGLSEHTAPYDALVQVLEGEVEVTISRKPLLLKEGEIVIMPSNQPHSLKALKRLKIMLVMIKS